MKRGDIERGDENDMQKPLLSTCPTNVRAGFLRKVYALLTMQLAMTTTTVLIMTQDRAISTAVLHTPGLGMGASVGALVALCPLFVLKDKHPWNFLLLLLFNMCESIAVGFVCTLYVSQGCGNLVLLSLVITMVTFGGLSAYVHITRRDLRFLEAFLGIALLSVLAMSIVCIFVTSPLWHIAVATAGILVFSGFVLYDTSMMLKYMTPDDAIIASVQLYLDILNLFLYILECMRPSPD